MRDADSARAVLHLLRQQLAPFSLADGAALALLRCAHAGHDPHPTLALAVTSPAALRHDSLQLSDLHGGGGGGGSVGVGGGGSGIGSSVSQSVTALRDGFVDSATEIKRDIRRVRSVLFTPLTFVLAQQSCCSRNEVTNCAILPFLPQVGDRVGAKIDSALDGVTVVAGRAVREISVCC